MSERKDRTDERQPQAVKPEDEEFSVEELDDVAGGNGDLGSDPTTINVNCPC